jgi:Holliday junction resolvase
MEKNLQTKIIKFLKEHHAYVIKTKPGLGTPVGCPDIIFLFEGAWGAVECKSGKSSPWQPGQEATLKKLNDWSPFVWKVYPENWLDIQKLLLKQFF